MLKPIDYIIGNMVLILYTYYAWRKISHQTIKVKWIYVILTSLLIMILSIISFIFTNHSIRFIVVTITLTLGNMCLYHNTLKNALILSMTSQLILLCAEMCYVFVMMLLSKIINIPPIIEMFGSIISNVSISFIGMILISLNSIRNKCQNLITDLNKINNYQMIIPISILTISINTLLSITYFKVDNIILLTINTILILLYTFIIVSSLKDKNSFIEAKEENRELSTHLKEYEEILSQQQRNNHESKTELAVVRNLLKKDKEAGLKCLDMIIGNKEDLDETFYQRCQKMPSGIQGVVYQKLLLADPNIQIYIEISPDIPKNDLENKLNSDIFLAGCKIIGVFLGNALEEVNEIESMNHKKISVQLYLEKNDTLVIQIGNTYRKNTDFSKLEEIGYTTKGKNHGQGLALVQDIENRYSNLSHITIVSGSMIFQKLKIKGLKL